MKTVAGAALSGAAGLIRSYGVDPETIARLAGWEPAILYDPDALLDVRQVLHFFELAATACQEPCFGIELAHHQGLEVLGSVWLVARRAEILEKALNTIVEAMGLYTSAIEMRAFAEGDGVVFTFDTALSENAPGEVQAVELAFALLCREVRAHAGAQWSPEYVLFRHARPASLRRHQQVFGRSLQFNQDRNALKVDKRALQLPLQPADKSHDIMRRELQRRQITLKEGFPSRVEQVVRNLVSSEICDVQRVAEALGISARTLQQKLTENDTTYQAILDRVRERLARKYLGESELSIAEIAELLQFSQTSAFSRFFSSQAGMSPRAYRKQYKAERASRC